MRLHVACSVLLSFHGIFALAQQTPLLQHVSSQHNVSAALFAELEELARVVDISYCVGGTAPGISTPFTCLSRCTDFPDFELVTTWNTGPLLADSCGYVALDHGKRRLIVAFRGTYSIANTIVDLSTIPQEYVPYPGPDDDSDNATSAPPDSPKCANCTVHSGFHSAWLHTRDAILPHIQQQTAQHPTYRLHLVGHSLGGAVAALAGLDLLARGQQPLVTTYGEPRVGNAALVRYLDARFGLLLPTSPSSSSASNNDDSSAEDATPPAPAYRRVTHVDDPVPLLPLTEWGYAMHAGEIYISRPALSPDIADLRLCAGDQDPACIAGQDGSLFDTADATAAASDDASPPLSPPAEQRRRHRRRDLLASVRDEIHDLRTEPWGIPSRYRLWQLFFAHRDYFWRLGLCVPGGDPLGGGGGSRWTTSRRYDDQEL